MIEIINHIPTILSFFIPGYIGLYVFKEVTGTDFKEFETISISCAGSYFITLVMRSIQDIPVSIATPITIWEFCFEVMVSLFVAYGLARLTQLNCFRGFLKRKLKFSPAKSSWLDVFDYENGMRVMLKMKNGKFIRGQVASLGNGKDDPWIALINFEVADEDQEEEYTGELMEDYLLINMSDIEYAVVSK